MHETPYEAERLLQELLADHPEVLVDEEGLDGGLILIKREAGLGDEPGTGARWSLDHLFLDAEGVPTFVEVKRAADTRGRREVVAQMLDYAANGPSYWTVDTLREWFGAECAKTRVDPAQALIERFPTVESPGEYWDAVETNLADGKLRLIFVSDGIPPELRRIVEFLNNQMTETEVLAIEVKQYVDEDGERQTIVPSVVGRTEVARRVKSRSQRRWDRDSLLAQIESRYGTSGLDAARRLMDWTGDREGVQGFFGRGVQDGSFAARSLGAHPLVPFVLYGYGRVEIGFQYVSHQPPFDDVALRQELRERLNAIDGIQIPPDSLERRPRVELETLAEPQTLEQFLGVMGWVFDQAT